MGLRLPGDRISNSDYVRLVDNDEFICPHCGAPLDDEEPKFLRLGRKDRVDMQMSCPACDEEWIEHYTLSGWE